MIDAVHGTKVRMTEAYVDGTRRGVTEIAITGRTVPTLGTVFTIQGTSKGKGFAGVVKRWGFAGGPRTHGQSDRTRAPGSIGQGTTPGRVRRNKKMAGRMGGDTKSVKNAVVVAVQDSHIFVTGPVPGSKNAPLVLKLTGSQEAGTVTIPGVNPTSSQAQEEVVEKSEEKRVEEQAEAKESSEN